MLDFDIDSYDSWTDAKSALTDMLSMGGYAPEVVERETAVWHGIFENSQARKKLRAAQAKTRANTTANWTKTDKDALIKKLDPFVAH
jgi:hypothetical protein